MKRFLLTLLLITSSLFSQEIKVEGPKKPIRQGGYARVSVLGIPEDSLKDYKISLIPNDGAYYVKLGSSGDAENRITYIVFVDEDATPGARSFSVSRNLWIKDWSKGLAEAIAGLTPEDSKALTALVSEYPKKYPFVESSAAFEVAGLVPPPPDDPKKPPPKDPVSPNKVTRVTYIYEKDNNNIPGPVALALNKINAGYSGSIVATEFEQNTTTGNNQIPAQYKTALTAAKLAGLPTLIVQGGITGDAVLATVKDPKTEKEVIDAVQQFFPPAKAGR